jgi:tRNA-specific 2-thiouridylase
VRIGAALSGGVDSAVAAARLLDAGHDVAGVHLVFTDAKGSDAVDSAGEVAEALGVPLEVVDVREAFERDVVAPFVAGYAAGTTPNPCIVCNPGVKFAALLARADALGFDAVSTGHYARVAVAARGVELRRARCLPKDQSYVLASLGVDALARCVFPLGEAASKEEVRAEADARGLPVSGRPESLDACFFADGGIATFLHGRLGEEPGPIVDETGATVGEHAGAWEYTIGQRKGLRLPRPAADGRPRYVTAVRPGSRTVVVGPAGALEVTALEGDDARWLADDLASIEPVPCAVQVRAHGALAPGRLSIADARMRVELAAPIRAVAPGQALVAYVDDRVVAIATAARR